MTPAPKPPTEAERLKTLQGLNVLDTPPDPVLDGLVRSAALALGCPISLVSLIDADRQWFKASYGLAVAETARAPSFCGHAILGDTVFEVPDAMLDARFVDSPLVLGDPNVRFYAGVPLDVDGQHIGTLCVIDRRPRQFTDAQRGLLADLGRAATHWMKSWRQAQTLDLHLQHLEARVSARTAELALAKQAAESANEAKSHFLATMSHEIRTPMNGVVGIVDVLRQSSLTPYQADLADTIRDSAFALLGILDDILDFSKIEAGHLALESEPVALLRLVEGVCDALQPVASGRRVALQVFVDPALPEWISSDAVRLRQILNNLLGNAIKFSAGLEREGRVRVRVEALGTDRLRLQVSDNGIGLSPAAQARVFDPFEQAEGSTSRRYGGTGLGLSICRRLVGAFGGEISLQSVPGQGAEFNVSLPLRRCVSAPAPSPVELASDLGGLHCHLLLADAHQAHDWCAYLVGAGAQAQAWSDPIRWPCARRCRLRKNRGRVSCCGKPSSSEIRWMPRWNGCAATCHNRDSAGSGSHPGSAAIRACSNPARSSSTRTRSTGLRCTRRWRWQPDAAGRTRSIWLPVCRSVDTARPARATRPCRGASCSSPKTTTSTRR